MRLLSLSFRNFRNLKDASVIDIPDAPLLVAAAPNATGKTNFLEAISVLLRGKSFRADHNECVAWGKDFFLVQGKVLGREGESDISVQYHVPSRKLRIEQDMQPVSPVLFYSNYPFVLFLPEDTFLFHRGPALRRNFLNNALSASTHYLPALVQYHRALRQRNSALKSATSREDLAAWTELVSEYAEVVWKQRVMFVEYLTAHLPAYVQSLLHIDDPITITLVRGIPEGQDLREALTAAWAQEEKYKYTLYGPHRDDIVVTVNDRPVQSVFSRGQIRSLVIAMKIVVYQFMKQTGKDAPLLLFDEVLSELDSQRQKHLFELLPPTQTLLTCTEIPSEVKKRSDVYMLDLKQLVGSPQETPAAKVAVESVDTEKEEKVAA